ncbi:MAG: HEAT repeat domain-containing protein [Myxococcales bacterium]|nr:HEAT repeat domain-containing protein [Myxococcales bacterium]
MSEDELALRPRRFNPVVIILAILGLGGAAATIVWFATRQEATRKDALDVIEEQKSIFMLPAKDQIPRWRQWAADPAQPSLQREALSQLAILKDPDGVDLCVKALAQPTDHRLRGVVAQALAHYGAPMADAAKPALLKVLPEAEEERGHVVWALVTLGEKSIFDQAMEMYRGGKLSSLQRINGGGAFDPRRLAALVSLEDFAKLAGDQNAGVRQLVATVLSDNADAKWTATLVQLVKDKEVVVAREAASGLGRIADEAAREPLLEALRNAGKDNRTKFLEAMRDGIGGVGLVLALDTIDHKEEPGEWSQYAQLFGWLEKLADPRTGDALVKWLDANPKVHPHWRAEAALRLAEIGDPRAAKYLGERMKHEAKDIYVKEKYWQADKGGHLLKSDNQRTWGARHLADLAKLHPDKLKQLADDAGEGVLYWVSPPRPMPHANGLRFLARVGLEKGRTLIRDWAFPSDPLPKEGQQPPMPQAFIVAQSALRYIGLMKDEGSFSKLTDQLSRKDPKICITEECLMGAGMSLLGMALRAVAVGAADGLSEWGDPKAQKPLIDLIEDVKWHAEARVAACNALAWVAEDKTIDEVVQKVSKFAADKDPEKQGVAACYAETLQRRPTPAAVPGLVALLKPDLQIGPRFAIAAAIGMAGVSGDAEQKLFDLLKEAELRNAAGLALIMGGSADAAARTIGMYADWTEALNELKDIWYRAFGYWSDKDLDRGAVFRWVENAHAIARVKLGKKEGEMTPQVWAEQRLGDQFDNLDFDNGPHSETRVVIRYRLNQMAKNGKPEEKLGAIQTLLFMKEQGSLMALRHAEGETGELASAAFHELMHPATVIDSGLTALAAEKRKKRGQGN